ncbi:MAG TPA: lipopolysaccharide assembly protein LapA domain-containing protein [Xanthobacteraceae bacterium]|nr:lipopolysaccharide assembly protein LapA domain-containing protein [Xanthobacteraceae bacterium]
MTNVTRSTGNVVRKVVAAIILVPLAVVIIAFAVANRQIVTVSLDPFSSEYPAASLTLPLFALVIVLLVVGVLIGGIAAWLRQARWRRTARRLEREIADLHIEIEGLKQTGDGFPSGGTAGPTGSERLQLRPPSG